MITELALTHPCDETIYWSAGAYRNRRGRTISQCPGCREALGSPFVRAEEAPRRPVSRRSLQLTAS